MFTILNSNHRPFEIKTTYKLIALLFLFTFVQLPLFAEDNAHDDALAEELGINSSDQNTQNKSEKLDLAGLLKYFKSLEPTPENTKQNAEDHANLTNEIRDKQKREGKKIKNARKRETASIKEEPIGETDSEQSVSSDNSDSLGDEASQLDVSRSLAIPAGEVPIVAYDENSLENQLQDTKELIEKSLIGDSDESMGDTTDPAMTASPTAPDKIQNNASNTLGSVKDSKPNTQASASDDKSTKDIDSSAAGSTASEKTESLEVPSVYTNPKYKDYFSASKQAASNYKPSSSGSNSSNNTFTYTPLQDAIQKEKEEENKKISLSITLPKSPQEIELDKKLKDQEIRLLEQMKDNNKSFEASANAALEHYKKLILEEQNKAKDQSKTHGIGASTKTSDKSEPQPIIYNPAPIALESIERLLSNRDLQVQRPNFVYNDIIKQVIAPKLEQDIDRLNVESYKKALETLSKVEEPGDTQFIAPSKVYMEAYERLGKKQGALFKKAADFIDDAAVKLALGEGDSTSDPAESAVSDFENSLENLKEILPVIIMTNMTFSEMFHKSQDPGLSDHTRYAMVKGIYLGLIEGRISKDQLTPKRIEALVTFIDEYMNKVQDNDNELTKAMVVGGCATKISLKEDFEKIKHALSNVEDIQVAMLSDEQRKNLKPNKTQLAKELKEFRLKLVDAKNKSEFIQDIKAKQRALELCQEMGLMCDVLEQEGNKGLSGVLKNNN